MKQFLLATATVIILPNQGTVIQKVFIPIGQNKTIEHKIKNGKTKSKIIQKVGKNKTIETKIGE